MSARSAARRSVNRRPVTARRSAMVVGEVRIYQELIRLAVERNRLEAERRMWGRRYGEAGQKLAIAARYSQELQGRLGLSPRDSTLRSRGLGGPEAQGGPPGGSARGVMELRYCPDR